MREFVDLYCERTGPEFWAEPLNAWTNLSFIAAAILAARLLHRRGVREKFPWVLASLCFGVGVGSFLFHTFATRWAQWADVIPIWALILGLVLYVLQRILKLRPGATGAVIGVLGIAGGAFAYAVGQMNDAPTPPLNGSLSYAPALLAMLALILVLWKRSDPHVRGFVAALVLFVVALGFRSADLWVCPHWPAGTHFLWHSFNGAMIAMVLVTIFRRL